METKQILTDVAARCLSMCYVDSWQRFTKTLLPDKKEFNSYVTMEDITDADYKHVIRVWEDFGIQKT